MNLIARREGERVILRTRGGYNWAERYPRIVAAVMVLRVKSIVIDGEVAVQGPCRVSACSGETPMVAWATGFCFKGGWVIMRIAVVVAGVAVSLAAATPASSATRPEASIGGTSDVVGSAGLVVLAQAYHTVVPKHHPMYHHYKHRYREPNPGRGRRR